MMVTIRVDVGYEALENPPCVSFRAKKYSTLIVVDPSDSKSEPMKVDTYFRSD